MASCYHFDKPFLSNNKFYKHLQTNYAKEKLAILKDVYPVTRSIIKTTGLAILKQS